MMEWQTPQMGDSPEVDPVTLSNYLSIRIASAARQQCVYFSFWIHGTGAQFIQVASSRVLTIAKRGENLTFDPSSIPTIHGELMYVGDILLKDASVTHRGQYLKYLMTEVLPQDTPVFDLKHRSKDPVGNTIPILTVRCGKSVSTKVAKLVLSTALCGEGTNLEIFISLLALSANQTKKESQMYLPGSTQFSVNCNH
jgi:hypothetical protein